MIDLGYSRYVTGLLWMMDCLKNHVPGEIPQEYNNIRSY